MTDLRIVDAPELTAAEINDSLKVPTGGYGNYSITMITIRDWLLNYKMFATQSYVDTKVSVVTTTLNNHTSRIDNPHQVTKAQVGLGNVDNTSDINKPVSAATQTALTNLNTSLTSVISVKANTADVDTKLALKANKTDVYTKSETYTKQESNDLVNNSISTALTPVNASLELAKRGIANRYDSSLTYNMSERVILTNGDIVKSTIDGNANNPNVNMTGWVKTNSASQIFDESGLSQQEWNNGVESLADLANIPTPKNGNRVFVKSVEKWYTYTPTTTEIDNGATVVGKWVMDIQDAYYASDFLPDSSVDNVAEPQDVAINKLYQYATSKGRAFIIDQPYYVESKIKGGGESYPALNPYNGGGVSHAIRVQSNSVLAFIGDGELKLVPNDQDFTAILLVHDVENYVILDPKLKGDKDTHLSTTGEQGICLHFGPSKNGYIRNPYVYNSWGDGYYFGFTFYIKPFIDVIVPTNLTIDNLKGFNLSRNGISLCGADSLSINGVNIKKVDRASPKAGIDIEPEEDLSFTDKMFIRNVKINNATFDQCAYPYAHNIFGSRNVNVSFTGTTKFINGGVTNIAALFQCDLGDENISTYQQNGQIIFENIVSTDTLDSDSFSNLFAYYSPENSIKTVINNWNVDTKVTNLFIRFPRSSVYTNSDGLRVEKFIFNKKPNSITIDSEAVSGNKCNINYHLGIQDDIKINVSGFKYYSTCYIGGYDIIATSIFNENDYINKLIIEPTANPSDGNAIYGRAVINNNYRKLSYSVPPGLTASQLGYGLQIQGSGFFMATTTPSGMMSFRQITNPYNGVEVLSSYGAWASP